MILEFLQSLLDGGRAPATLRVLSSSNLNRPVRLAQFVPSEGEDRFKLLCPVRALRAFYRVNVATPHPLAVVLLPDSAVPSQ
ncbi:unnamed protein product [Boreogadus saida]